MDLAWNLFMSSALELDQPFLAESGGVCLPVKHSLQEQVCTSKATSTMGLNFPRYSSSDLPAHKGGMFSGPLLEAVLVYAGFVTPAGPGADPPASLVDPLIECMGESGSATMGSSAPCNSGSHVELCHAPLWKWGCTCPKPWSHVAKAGDHVKGISYHSVKTLASEGVFTSLACAETIGGDISLQNQAGLRHQAGFETLILGCRCWKHQWETWILLGSPGSNIARAHLNVAPSHNPFVGDRVSALLSASFQGWKDIPWLSTVSVKCFEIFGIYRVFLSYMLIYTELATLCRKWRL